MVTPYKFVHRLKSQNYILTKLTVPWDHGKVLLKTFNYNGHTTGLKKADDGLEVLKNYRTISKLPFIGNVIK